MTSGRDTDERGTSGRVSSTRRSRLGRLLGPAAAVLVHQYLATTELSAAGAMTGAVTAWMAVWWVTEAVPLAITSLLPVALFPVLGVADVEEATRPYASSIIFLFAGGFLLAQAVQRWNLHRRIALHVVLASGTSPRRIIGGFMVATGLLSMWVSNTATVVMMLPIGLSVLALTSDEESDGDGPFDARRQPFATALMLAIAYSASIGSVATLIGTPPNGILAGHLAQRGTPIGFGQWMLLGVPIAVVFMVIAWVLLTRVLFRIDGRPLPGGRQPIRAQLDGMGPVSRSERRVAMVFVAMAVGWMARPAIAAIPGLGGIDDSTIAMTGAIALFMLPAGGRRWVMLLDWPHARRIPWDILVLFGGGLSLAAAIDRNGLASYVGNRVGGLHTLHVVALIAVVATMVVFLTEITSNTATAAVLIPTLAGAAVAMGLDPLLLVVPTTLVATFAFMLPVATPPNAIVFGSGRVTVADMARAGILLNLVGVALSTAAMVWLAPHVLTRW